MRFVDYEDVIQFFTEIRRSDFFTECWQLWVVMGDGGDLPYLENFTEYKLNS